MATGGITVGNTTKPLYERERERREREREEREREESVRVRE
jgi:hypothetical protein